jgi:hypothetical protein
MRKIFAVVLVVLVSGLFQLQSAHAAGLCGGKSKAIQCQPGIGRSGNRFFNPKMDPRFNPQVDPRFNPQADPRFNPKADPRFNPKADPRFNPGATPCDLGIGTNCPRR